MVGVDWEEQKKISTVVYSLLPRFISPKMESKIYAFPSNLPLANFLPSRSV